MAVRFDAAGDYLARTTSLWDYNASYTVALWLKLSVDQDNYSHIFAISAGPGISNFDHIGTDNDGTTLRQEVDGPGVSNAVTGSSLSIGTWYHVALVRTSVTEVLVYLNGVLDITNSHGSVASRSAANLAELGQILNILPINGLVCHVKIYGAALTVDEIVQEMRTARPIRTANLYGWWPLFSYTDLVDYSGNGRDLTVNGTLSTEDGPPVSWGAPVWVVQIPAAAGGTNYPQSVAGALTSVGALARVAGKLTVGALTSSGAATRQTARPISGALTPAAILARTAGKVTSGAATPSGATARETAKPAAGSVTSSGTQTRTTNKLLAGTLATAGELQRTAAKLLDGALTAAGGLARATGKTLSGALSPSGALVTSLTFLVSLAGALTSSGGVTRQTGKATTGAVTSAGTINREISTGLGGVLTSAGGLARATAKTVAGALSPNGVLATARAYLVSLAGTLSSSGIVARATAKSPVGTLTPGGGLTRGIGKVVAGALSWVGMLTSLLSGDSVRLLDVAVSDAAIYVATLADAAVYAATVSDAAVTNVALSDAARS